MVQLRSSFTGRSILSPALINLHFVIHRFSAAKAEHVNLTDSGISCLALFSLSLLGILSAERHSFHCVSTGLWR